MALRRVLSSPLWAPDLDTDLDPEDEQQQQEENGPDGPTSPPAHRAKGKGRASAGAAGSATPAGAGAGGAGGGAGEARGPTAAEAFVAPGVQRGGGLVSRAGAAGGPMGHVFMTVGYTGRLKIWDDRWVC